MLNIILIFVTLFVPNVLPRPTGDDDLAGGGVIAGGYQPMDQADPEVKQQLQDLTKFAVKTMDSKSNDLYHGHVVRVTEAEYQIVEGANYQITFYIGQSQCQKNKVR